MEGWTGFSGVILTVFMTLLQVRKINAPQFAQPRSPLTWRRVPHPRSPLDHMLSRDTNPHVGSLLVCSVLSTLSPQGLWSPYTQSSPETHPGPYLWPDGG